MYNRESRTKCSQMDIEVISLRSKIEEVKSDKVSFNKLKEALSLFSCPKNLDEEDFIHNKAIDFEQLNKARTYLLIKDNKIIAYFSLAFKSIDLELISKTTKKNITAGEKDVKTYSAYLIGHIAKDSNYKQQIGCYILDMAMDLIYDAQRIVGGRLVYLDCKDEKKLIDLYTQYGFKYFNKYTTLKDNIEYQQYYMKL